MTFRRLRTILNCTCHAPGVNVDFDVPTDMHFGDVASEGTAITFARADHRHGMPPTPSQVILALLEGGFAFHELAVTNAALGASQGILARIGLSIQLGEDNANGTGGFGQIRMNTATASPNQASALVVMANVPTGSFSTNTGTQSLETLKEFRCTCHPQKQLGTGIPTNVDVGIGGFLFDIPDNANFHINNIVAGIGFVGEFDVNGDGNWFARIYDGHSQVNSIDTEIPLNSDGTTGLVSNQTFKILRENGDLGFFIDGALVAVMEAPTIPDDLVCGYGAFIDHIPRTTNHSLFVDQITLRGLRFG